MAALHISLGRTPAGPKESRVTVELERFFGGNLATSAIVSRTFAPTELPNLESALHRMIERSAAIHRLLGYSTQYERQQLDLRALVSGAQDICVAPVVLRDIDVDVDGTVKCVAGGIHLIDGSAGKVAVHVHLAGFREDELKVEVLSESAQTAGEFVDSLRAEMRQSNVYSGKVLSFDNENNPLNRHPILRFHRIPRIQRDDIVLPARTLELIERNTIHFFQHAEALRRSGQPLKRGVLLHGKPGTGKTYTAKWLARSLTGVTAILLTGEQLWQIKRCCELARLLAPSLVIVEDVDLIAAERDDRRGGMQHVSLHQLLNEMDGMADDAEVLFLLTTNRPDVLEPALRDRPGRVDQAIEYPLPDAEGRRRLIELYGRGLALSLDHPERIVSKTDGVSPAFIRELLRKASLAAAEDRSFDGERIRVRDAHLEAALNELVLGGELTQRLLGFSTTT